MAKSAVPVDKQKLLQCIQQAEDENVENLGAFYKRVAEIYNSPKVTHSVVMLRMTQWNLPKPKIDSSIRVDKQKLLKCIQEAEKDGPLEGLVALYKRVAEIYNEPKVTYSVVGLRVVQWELPKQTKAGRKGRAKGFRRGDVGKRTPKAEKFKSETIQKILQEQRATVPERFQPVMDKLANGSRSAAVKLKCLECTSWMTQEVRLCPATECALYLFRPYQGSTNETDETEADEEAA